MHDDSRDDHIPVQNDVSIKMLSLEILKFKKISVEIIYLTMKVYTVCQHNSDCCAELCFPKRLKLPGKNS